MRLVSLLAVVALVGCVDPEAEYEAFRGRLDDGPSAPDDAGLEPHGDAAACLPTSAAGEYVLALAAVLQPETPIVSAVTLEATDEPPTLTFATIQPLASADRATPVGASFSAGPFDVVDGRVTALVTGLRVAGQANPISGGDIAADVTLEFELCLPDRVLCGQATGSVTEPLLLDLAGSTFTLVPVDDAGADLPIDCDGTPADPI